LEKITCERIRQVLIHREKKRITDPRLAPSSVLVPIYRKASECHVLFIKRTETVQIHKGQISFPGGKKDASDSDFLATALRESYEEIGIDPEAVEVLGELDDERTNSSNFVIHPFLGIIPYPYEFKLSREEVEGLVEIPIPKLMDESSWREEIRTEEGKTFRAYYYHYDDLVIWGATARILKKFLDLIQDQGLFLLSKRRLNS
jgi:8-oxo-dGTP pyrophosphatase MutT (NUDIX family)